MSLCVCVCVSGVGAAPPPLSSTITSGGSPSLVPLIVPVSPSLCLHSRSRRSGSSSSSSSWLPLEGGAQDPLLCCWAPGPPPLQARAREAWCSRASSESAAAPTLWSVSHAHTHTHLSQSPPCSPTPDPRPPYTACPLVSYSSWFLVVGGGQRRGQLRGHRSSSQLSWPRSVSVTVLRLSPMRMRMMMMRGCGCRVS